MSESNIGLLDQIIRIVAGVALLSLVFVGPKTMWGYLGIVPLITGGLGYSPTYALFRFSTVGSMHRIPKHA